MDGYLVIAPRFFYNEIISKSLTYDEAVKVKQEYNKNIRFFFGRARIETVSSVLFKIYKHYG